MTSTVTRKERWVHLTAKESLEKIEIAEQRNKDAAVTRGIDQIEHLKLHPIVRFFFYPKLPKENTPENVIKWLKDDDRWSVGFAYYWTEKRKLNLIIDATTPDLMGERVMTLSLKDSSMLEYWSKFE